MALNCYGSQWPDNARSMAEVILHSSARTTIYTTNIIYA